LGGYLANRKITDPQTGIEDSAMALKPGAHLLVGIRLHLNPTWSLLIEDRIAFTTKAQGGFGGMDLGGNFLSIGCTYQF